MARGPRDCLAIDEVIAFYEGGLDADVLAGVEAHLDSCATCRLWLSQVAPTVGSSPQPSTTDGRAGTFRVGALVASRYRIVRFIARGGMGEVYEAEDLDLGERVALKTVNAVLADDAKAIERLKREVSLARRVTHPNVCRIFDLGTDERGSERVAFLTMELLEGEPLSERLRRGVLALDEARSLAAQMAAALEAAHRVGVVHRDFKSSNVMLVPATGGTRVVVTDFGLAHEAGGGAGEAFVGSPAYMAPEQVEGDTIDARTDVYAFGVVLFEMVTGKLPFDGATPAALAAQRLARAAPSARRFVPSLPLDFERVIARCLERDRAARFASARDAVAALDSRRRRRRTGAALALGALGLAGLVAGGLVVHRVRGARPHPLRTAAAVAGFVDHSPSGGDDTAWRGAALAELLSAELVRSPELRVVPTKTVAAMQRDLAVAVAASYDAATLARMRRRIAADWLIAGSFAVEGDALTLDLALEDAGAGNIVVTLHERGRADGMAALVERVAARLRAQLGLSARGATATTRALPSSPEAARLYVDGLVHARARDVKLARPLLERAVAAEPSFAPAHAALAELYVGLRLHARARDEAKAALERAGELPREQQLAIEARYWAAQPDWPKAIDIYRALCMFYPDDLDDGVALARAQAQGGRGPDAVATIARLRKLPRPAGDDPRLDETEALAWGKQGEWKKRLAASERAIAAARAMDARLMVADNELGAAETLISLGELARAEALYRDAEHIFDEAGDQSSAMEALVGLGDLARSRGDSRAAADIYERAIALHKSEGDEYGVADMLNGLAAIVQDFGELGRSKKLYEESLAHFRAIGEREGVANVLNNYALVLVAQGELDGAAARFAESLGEYRAIGMRSHEASTLGNMAYVERRQGKMRDARAHLEQSLAMLTAVGDEQMRVQFEADQGVLEREQDRLDEARRAWQAVRAVAVRREMPMFVQQADVALAQLAVDADDGAEAERLARAAAAPLVAGTAKEPAASALAVLSRALLLTGKRKEAADAAARAVALVAHSEDPAVRADARSALVTARAAVGDCASALREAAAFERDEAGRQPVDERFEAALARGRAERACDQPTAARARLSELAARATASGYLRIARLAR